jgi:Fe2+ transport system protein FeoA
MDPACSNSCSLAQLGVGCCGKVLSVSGDADLRRRLLEMGLCGGATVECVRKAPLGDPIEYKIRGYLLSLRGEQARCVTVQAL